MNKCQVKSVKKGDEIEFVFSGSIDESLANYLSIFPAIPKITINLEEINSINSTGIREWINLMTKLETSKITLTNCPKIFIDQVNMVKGFLSANAVVESFYVPYYSESADAEKKIKLEKANGFKYENTITDPSGTVYEIDVIVSKYFKFIQG
ncbi:MAG: hypothetical protein AABY53_06375 [Bdellovibrionota bacterium]